MGKSRKLRIQAEDKWPSLTGFMFGCLGEHWTYDAGSPEAAVDQGIQALDLKGKQAVVKEWWDWNAQVGSKADPRRDLNDGLGVNVYFNDPMKARAFMNEVYDKLIVAIRDEERGWRA